ncbi:hypothetical protein ABZ023_18430 [Streptomyces sp. NPDC006367]|uniref:hypothetical protein n=1 Tax=unclassified Streptomyces TaxID=2593676 RepID=UPI0033AC7D3B
MPVRTMLPPNLTRHFYETRRALLQSVGQEATPWFLLPPQERSVVESEMEIFRQAIRRAEEEQDLLASLDTTRAAAAAGERVTEYAEAKQGPTEQPAVPEAAEPTETPAAAERLVQDCGCPDCALFSLISQLVEKFQELEASSKDRSSNGTAGTVFQPILPAGQERAGRGQTAAAPAPLSSESLARLQASVRTSLDEWVALGKPVDVLEEPVFVTVDLTPPRLTEADLDRALNSPAARRFDALRREFRTSRKRATGQA